MPTAELRELVAKLEAASWPNYELERQIRDAVHPALERAPAYTASLDAALTLVPEGWRWSVYSDHHHRLFDAVVANDGLKHEPVHSSHNNPSAALALCIAALNARLENANDR